MEVVHGLVRIEQKKFKKINFKELRLYVGISPVQMATSYIVEIPGLKS